MSSRSILSLLVAAATLILLPLSASAYSYRALTASVESGGSTLYSDAFDDGAIDPLIWNNGIGGVVVEGAGGLDGLLLSSPGVPINLGPAFVGETSFISGAVTQLDLTTNSTQFQSTWEAAGVATPGDAFGIALAGLSPGGDIVRGSLNVSNLTPAVAAAVSAATSQSILPGLQIIFQTITQDLGTGAVLSIDAYESIAVSASDLAMGVALNLSFDPTSGLLTASGTHLAGNFVSGAQSYDSNFVSYNLTASNIVPVPEPGTALLMGLGLAGLTGAGGRRSAA